MNFDDSSPDIAIFFIVQSSVGIGEPVVSCDSCEGIHRIGKHTYYQLIVPIDDKNYLTHYITPKEASFIRSVDGYRPGRLANKVFRIN